MNKERKAKMKEEMEDERKVLAENIYEGYYYIIYEQYGNISACIEVPHSHPFYKQRQQTAAYGNLGEGFSFCYSGENFWSAKENDIRFFIGTTHIFKTPYKRTTQYHEWTLEEMLEKTCESIKYLKKIDKGANMKEFSYTKERKCEIVEDSTYKGYHYVIRDLGSHPTAYVEIPKANTVCDDFEDIDCHGGITYTQAPHWDKKENDERLFIGWDYAHCDDFVGRSYPVDYELTTKNKKWTIAEVLADVKNVIEQLIEGESKVIIELSKIISKGE